MRLSVRPMPFIVFLLFLFTSATGFADVVQGEMELVSSKRVTRYDYEYSYRLNISNNGDAITNVSATVASASGDTLVVDADLSFDDLAAGASGVSTDTFSFQQNRRIPFDPANLQFTFTYDETSTPTDEDGDGYSPDDGSDCDDSNASIHVGATDIPGNGIDEDCDGADTPLTDADGDGYSPDDGSDCDDTNPAIYVGATDIPGNGIDEDCDGADTPLTDADGDGYSPVDGSDCDDTNPAIYVGATEIPGNGIDEDCDGVDTPLTDADGDGYSPDDGSDCDDTNPNIHVGAVDIFSNGIDEDCDGLDAVNPVDQDGDGYTIAEADDCDDTNPNINPGAFDIPENGIDEDCDGVDANDPDDLDGDGYTPAEGDCDDSNSEINPGAASVPNNGVDENCDGEDPVVGPDFSVRILTPASLTTVGASPIAVTGIVEGSGVALTVNGVAVNIASDNTFSTNVAVTEGHNTIVARGVKDGQDVTDSISISLDLTPPYVTIESHTDGQDVYSDSITVTGLVNDIVRGTVEAAEASVTVNGVNAAISNRSYAATSVPLVEGSNTITVTGVDQVGNTSSTSIAVNYVVPAGRRIDIVSGQDQTGTINTELDNALRVQVLDDSLSPVENSAVVFRVTQGSGAVGVGTAEEGRAVVLSTDSNGFAQTIFKLGARVGTANHKVRARVVGYDDEAIFTASATGNIGNKISVNSGNNQRGAVGQVLPEALVVVVTDDGANVVENARVRFDVTVGGGELLGVGSTDGSASFETQTDSDGRATVEYQLGFLEGLDAQRITATLLDAPTDSDGNILPINAGFTATAFVPADPGLTSISGVVLDNQDAPIPGVTVRIDGSQRQGITDAEGQFIITQAPVGPVHLVADGSTASVEGEFPSLSYNLVTIAGVDNPLAAPIYMVKLNTDEAVYAGPNDVELILDKYPGFKLEIAANSATFPDGSREGLISVTSVNASKVPMAPPNGMQPQFIVTIQPTGTLFDPPARLTLPNVDGHAPGAQVEMYSYDHDLEEFVSIGLGTVTEDGSLVTSNPGVGVVKAGWHCGSQPGGNGCAHNCPVCQDCDGDCNCVNKNDDPRLKTCETCNNGTKVDAPTDNKCCQDYKNAKANPSSLLGTVICCRAKTTLCMFPENFPNSGNAKGDEIGYDCVEQHEASHVHDKICDDDDCNSVGKLKPGITRADSECDASKKEKQCLENRRGECAGNAACESVVDGWIQGATDYGNRFKPGCI